MSCYLHNAGHPWQGSGEKIEIKTLRKEFGSNKEKKKRVECKKKKRGEKGTETAGRTQLYQAHTRQRLVISNTGICETVTPCCVVALYTQPP